MKNLNKCLFWICVILALFIVVYAVEEEALISKQPVYQYYNMLDCDAKERFQNHRWLL